MNVWIAIARLLYCFDFEEDKVSKESSLPYLRGHIVLLTISFVKDHPIDTMTIPQITHGKAPFAVKIKPRSPQHAALIERECIEAVHTKY